MSAYISADLEDIATFLAAFQFRCVVDTVGPFARVLLAEDPYTSLLVVEVTGTDGLARVASDAQAELTKLAKARSDSSKRWDLYVVIHVRAKSLMSIDANLIEMLSSDTAYARKLVRVNLSRDERDLTKALRPFLPIHSSGAVAFVEPLRQLAEAMRGLGVPESDVTAAFDSFETDGSVVLT